MTRRHLLSALLSVLLIAGVGFDAWMQFSPRGFPANAVPVNPYTFELHAFPGMSLPPGFEEGDRVDLTKQSFALRVAVVTQKLPLGYTVYGVIDRGPKTLRIPTTTVDFRGLSALVSPGVGWHAWPQAVSSVLLCGIALLLLWRGRDRAAFGMALWAITFLFSSAVGDIPLSGWPALLAFCIAVVFFLTARVGFYIMVEARVAAALSPRQRAGFRIGFFILLALGALYALGGPLWFIATGWRGLMKNEYGLILTASYFVPIAMLVVGYRTAPLAERQRLRWMLASSFLWVMGILVQNTPVFGPVASGIVNPLLLTLALLGFLYAVLRHRVVDISVVIDRALVYGLMTTLILGMVAAMNSLALRETLTPGAGLLLQVVVPLALGIVLGRVRSYMDLLVERVFFRSKYLAEKALRTFANRVGHIQDVRSLLETAVREIRRNLGVPAVVIYSAEDENYRRMQAAGAAAFPVRLKADDPALVAVRAEQQAVDLGGLESGLGEDGCIFPMMVLGTLRGVIVCANRPGEHYAADEKRLMTEVAREVGAAWRILRARDNEAYVRAMAEGELTLKAAREKARSLAVI
ncbi:MAG TPA: GAF domain-containing protein [Gammaproteobacteria bacterium]|nr:GAF domain-containing protein [Gammaproteobacteria bacterium]